VDNFVLKCAPTLIDTSLPSGTSLVKKKQPCSQLVFSLISCTSSKITVFVSGVMGAFSAPVLNAIAVVVFVLVTAQFVHQKAASKLS
jgi:hypothetical protein